VSPGAVKAVHNVLFLLKKNSEQNSRKDEIIRNYNLKVDGNEKLGGSERRQLFSFCLASRVISNLNV